VLPHILSIAGPIFSYITLALVVWGIYRQRSKLDRWALIPAGIGFAFSILLIPSVHLLFFDEDIYINIASNLSHGPVAQLTLLGGQDRIEASTYYKEPTGFPVLLSLAFLFTGTGETTAFVVARLLYAATLASFFLLARRIFEDRKPALWATLLFGGTSILFRFSASSGTDLAAALFSILGVLGIVSGNGLLAASALAMAAQVRLEMIVLLPLLLLARSISTRWKLWGLALAGEEILHLIWVFSIAPTLAKAEQVPSAFSVSYVLRNSAGDLKYLFNPLLFPVGISILAVAAILYGPRKASVRGAPLQSWIALPAAIYLVFYLGSFELNPRFSIQILAPLVLLAFRLSTNRYVTLGALGTLAFAYLPTHEIPNYVTILASDHEIAVRLAARLGGNDLVISTEPEIFLNHGIHAMNTVLASERESLVREQFQKYGKVWYYSGVRTNVVGTQQSVADRWMKSHFDLHPVESHENQGFMTSIYEVSPNPVPAGRGTLSIGASSAKRGL
jgi:hypothetical protein